MPDHDLSTVHNFIEKWERERAIKNLSSKACKCCIEDREKSQKSELIKKQNLHIRNLIDTEFILRNKII